MRSGANAETGYITTRYRCGRGGWRAVFVAVGVVHSASGVVTVVAPHGATTGNRAFTGPLTVWTATNGVTTIASAVVIVLAGNLFIVFAVRTGVAVTSPTGRHTVTTALGAGGGAFLAVTGGGVTG